MADEEQLKKLLVVPHHIRVAGEALYTLYATKHSDSRFTNSFFESKLKVKATTRNFNTMTRLVEMCGSAVA